VLSIWSNNNEIGGMNDRENGTTPRKVSSIQLFYHKLFSSSSNDCADDPKTDNKSLILFSWRTHKYPVHNEKPDTVGFTLHQRVLR
jgi:hypothetical protein